MCDKILFSWLRLLKLMVSLFFFLVLWLIDICVFIFLESFIIKFCMLGLIFFFGLGGVGLSNLCISFLVLWMVNFFFEMICVVLDCVLLLRVSRVCVCFILILLCLISNLMLLLRLFRCSRFVMVVCDLFIVLVILECVSLNLFISCFSVWVFFMVLRFLCWIFLINVIVIVVLLVIFLIKYGIIFNCVSCVVC